MTSHGELGRTFARGLVLGALILMALLSAAQSAEILALQLDPSRSWIQDNDWFEIIPNAQGAIPPLYYGGAPFDYTPPLGIYHSGQPVALSGTIRVVLGGAYPLAIELNNGNVAPGTLPSGHNIDLTLGASTLRNGIFPNDSFPSTDEGICACLIETDPSAPRITGSYDGKSLVVDAQWRTDVFMQLPVVSWVGNAPASTSYFALVSRPSFHLEAAVVPVPSALGLFGGALGLLLWRPHRRGAV